jgi:hypothetical protein
LLVFPKPPFTEFYLIDFTAFEDALAIALDVLAKA